MSRTRVAALWFSVLGPLVAVFLQQQVGYVLVKPACVGRERLLLQLVPVLMGLAIAVWAGIIAWRGWTRAGRPVTDDRIAARSDPFFGFVGLTLGSLALALIVALWLAVLFVDPCQR